MKTTNRLRVFFFFFFFFLSHFEFYEGTNERTKNEVMFFYHRLDFIRTVCRQIRRQLNIKSIDSTHATLLINGKEIKYDWIFLRDSCQCSNCVDPSTQQKRFETTEIPLTIGPKENGLKILEKTRLEILWNSNHRSEFSSKWLNDYSSEKNLEKFRFDDRPMIFWNRKHFENVDVRISANEFLHNDRSLFRALTLLNDYGLVLIENVQDEEFAVEKLTERIGNIRSSFYGKSWDVKSVANAINVAYTSQALGLHMDLLYFEAPPGLQYLHCLENSVQGGASYFVDAFSAAEQLRCEDPESFQILCHYPVTFHYRNAGRHYHRTRSTFVLDRTDSRRLDHINYSPPFQGPFQSDTSDEKFRRFIIAFRRFRDLIENDQQRFEFVLRPGQCVIFHNRRILHARRAFDSTSGKRWLKGCYTDLDNFYDRLRIYRERFEGK